MPGYRELKPEELAWRLGESEVPPETAREETAQEAEAAVGTVGQERALRALEFGLGIRSFGYNIYVMGQTGTGKTFMVREVLERKSKEGPPPDDWLYVMDFANPDRPMIIGLPRGKGCELKADMDRLLAGLQKEIPKAFEGENFEKRREEILTEHNRLTTGVLDGLSAEAESKGFSLERSPRGLVLVPRKKDGSLMSQEEFEQQETEAKHAVEEKGNELQSRLGDAMRKVRDLEKEFQEQLKDLNREFGMNAVGHLVDDLIEKYKEFPKLGTYFNEVREDALAHLDDFRQPQQAAQQLPFMPRPEPSFDRYKVNLLVDNCTVGGAGAPVVFEHNPTYPNLFGRIE